MKCIILILGVAFVIGEEVDISYLTKLDNIKSEEPCLNAGGMCTYGDDCPKGHLGKLGLCPEQRRFGIECCHGVSKKDTRCRKHGGECLSVIQHRCNPNLVFLGASDCRMGFECCILV